MATVCLVGRRSDLTEPYFKHVVILVLHLLSCGATHHRLVDHNPRLTGVRVDRHGKGLPAHEDGTMVRIRLAFCEYFGPFCLLSQPSEQRVCFELVEHHSRGPSHETHCDAERQFNSSLHGTVAHLWYDAVMIKVALTCYMVQTGKSSIKKWGKLL